MNVLLVAVKAPAETQSLTVADDQLYVSVHAPLVSQSPPSLLTLHLTHYVATSVGGIHYNRKNKL